MVGPEGAGVMLGVDELEVVVDREDLGFSMKVGFGGFVVCSRQIFRAVFWTVLYWIGRCLGTRQELHM